MQLRCGIWHAGGCSIRKKDTLHDHRHLDWNRGTPRTSTIACSNVAELQIANNIQYSHPDKRPVCRATLIDEGLLLANRAVRMARRQPLQMPLMGLFGDSDVAIMLNSIRNIGSVSPNADIRIVPRCSHWVQQDAPDDATGMLAEFFTR